LKPKFSDLARLTGLHVTTMAGVIIVRELVGVIENVIFVKIVFWIAQLSLDLLQTCAVSFQSLQILTVFSLATLSEWQEDLVVRIHRLILLIVGGGTGVLVCSVEAGMCRPTPLYHYLLNQDLAQINDKPSVVSVLSTLISFSIILICQISIETKRFFVNREEAKANRVVGLALKQMDEATSRKKSQPMLELGVESFPATVKRAWEEEQSNRNISTPQLPIHLQTNQPFEPIFNQLSHRQAFKVVLKGLFFGFFVLSVVIIFVSFDVMKRIRPHGTVAFMISTFGIFVPLTAILQNKEMKAFASNYITTRARSLSLYLFW